METNSSTRMPTPEEVGHTIKILRDIGQWTQETLAELSGCSVRTIQRIEMGLPSDLESRRAIARAFECEDLDVFNKPHAIPTPEELSAQREKFERENLTLDFNRAKSGRQLGVLFETVTMDLSSPVGELGEHVEAAFASLIDYLRDYRDCADAYTETQKLDVFADLQGMLDELVAAGAEVGYSVRDTKIVGTSWADKSPYPVRVVYLHAFEKGAVPDKIAVTRKLGPIGSP